MGTRLLIGEQHSGREKLIRLTQKEHLMKEPVETNRSAEASLIRQPKHTEISASTGCRYPSTS